MTNSRCESVNSYWCAAGMNPTTSLTSLLTLDLKTRSAGAAGRELFAALELYCTDLLEASTPLEFALALRGVDPRSREALEGLLEWTAAMPSFQLSALVALAPELERVARRLGHGSPSDDTIAEVMAQATQALRGTEDRMAGERRAFVLGQARLRARSEQRMMARHNVRADSLPADFDRAVDESLECPLAQCLDEAESLRVISPGDRALIEVTRSGGRSVRDVAVSTAVASDVLYKRRQKAERRLRAFYGRELTR